MSRPPEIMVRNWSKFQHYKKRNPPWIRLYRELIDTPEWRSLSDSAARLLVELWLLASEFDPGGRVPYDTMLLAWRTGRASADASANASIVASLQELADQRFIALPNYASTNASTNASADASTSTPQRQSTETEPTLRARGSEPSDNLSEWLGKYAEILDDCPPAEDHLTRTTLHQHFGPPGLRAKAWQMDDGGSVPEEERPRLFALALSGYAGEGNDEIVTSEFAGMLKRVIRDETGAVSSRGSGNATGFVATDKDYEPGGMYYAGGAGG